MRNFLVLTLFSLFFAAGAMTKAQAQTCNPPCTEQICFINKTQCDLELTPKSSICNMFAIGNYDLLWHASRSNSSEEVHYHALHLVSR